MLVCEGCGWSCPDGNEDIWHDHIMHCDRVDGAGRRRTLDPKQAFAMCSLTREDIADDLNAAVDNLDLEQIDGDDIRLTDAVCREYALSLGAVYLDAASETEDWFEEAVFNLKTRTARSIGLIE